MSGRDRTKDVVLFGLGDNMQWAKFTRDQHPEIFAAWDRGEDNVFSGAENTQLWSREDAEGYLEYATRVIRGAA